MNMSSDNDKMTVVILFQYVIDYVILTTVGQFEHGIAFRPHCNHGIAIAR